MDDICNAIRELGPKRKAEIESYMTSLSLCEQSKMKSSGFHEINDVSYAFYHGLNEFSKPCFLTLNKSTEMGFDWRR